MLCNNCGHVVDNDNIFCGNCNQIQRKEAPELFAYQPVSEQPIPSYMFPHNPWKHAPGRKYLLVAGIILIIFGVLGLLISAAGIALAFYWDRIMPVWGMSWSTYYTVTLLVSILGIFVGIMGVVNRARPGRGLLCMILAVVYITASVTEAVFASVVFFANYNAAIVVIFLVIDIILLVVYFIGGKKNAEVNGNSHTYSG